MDACPQTLPSYSQRLRRENTPIKINRDLQSSLKFTMPGQNRDRMHEEVSSPRDRSYENFPSDRPFIYSSFRLDPNKPIKAYPQNNSEAVKSALLNLQKKIKQLENDRDKAKKSHKQADLSFRSIGLETSRNHGIEAAQQSSSDSICGRLDTKDLEAQLSAAESRSELLEKQLEYMRRMVANAEKERADTAQRSALLREHHLDIDNEEIRRKIDKIHNLERDHLEFTATQSLTEAKIRDLEEKLSQEQQRRKRVQQHAAEMESQAETNRLLLEVASENANPPKKSVRRKKKKTVSKPRVKKVHASPSDHTEHYHLNLKQIPFVAGTDKKNLDCLSTTPSHSVPVNIQRLLSLMKNHHPQLCSGSTGSRHTPHQPLHTTRSSSGYQSGGDLNDLLTQLQDEFSHMSFEHQELSQQLYDTADTLLKEDLERELDQLTLKMGIKGDQIAKLRRHKEQDEIQISRTNRHESPQSAQLDSSHQKQHLQAAHATLRQGSDEVEVRTTVRTKRGSAPHAWSYETKDAKDFLHDLKRVQSKLQMDDVAWE